MAGNILGRRSYYTYTDDEANDYSIQMDDTLAAAVGATLGATDPAPPRRFRPRRLFVERSVDGVIKRKELVVTDVNFAGYASNVSTNVTIDGLVWITTGRKGEALSFPKNADAVDVADQDTDTP